MSEPSAEAREQAKGIVHAASIPALSSTHMDRIIDTIARALAEKDVQVAEARRERDAERTRYVLANAGWKEMNRQVAALEADLAAILAGLQEAVHPAYCPDCRHRQRDHKRIGATCCQEDWCGCQREFHVVSPAAALASSPVAAWLEKAKADARAAEDSDPHAAKEGR